MPGQMSDPNTNRPFEFHVQQRNSPMPGISDFIAAMPKCELHVHLEGTLEAELKFALARRNGISLPYASPGEMRAAYIYHDLPSFLKIFYEGSRVLVREQDFYDLCYAYLSKARAQNIVYAEMFFDPQQHLSRAIPFADIVNGLSRARRDAERELGIHSQLIMCFLREESAESAMATLLAALPFRHEIVGIGLDSDEKGNPPGKFADTFARARTEGFRLTMHCDVDQENTHDHIAQAIEQIGVERIDHGVNVLDDERLIALARERGLAFTLCPYGNEIVRPGHKQAPVRQMLDLGLRATLNSDDPAYMESCYLNENFAMAQRDAALSRQELLTLTRNAFEAAWIDDRQRQSYLALLDSFAGSHAGA
jgi:adenine deaminase